MTLSKSEIESMMDDGELVITPLLDRKLQVHEDGVDLRLGSVFISARYLFAHLSDPVQHASSRNLRRHNQERVQVPLGHTFTLYPGESVRGVTFEYVVLPGAVSGLMMGRSFWESRGLVFATTVMVNPGNKHYLNFDLVNMGNAPISLYPGVRIGQLILARSDEDSMAELGQNAARIRSEHSIIHEDIELKFLRD